MRYGAEGTMSVRTNGRLRTGVWAGLLLIASSACMSSAAPTVAPKPAAVVQQPATTSPQSTTTSQTPSYVSAAEDTGKKAQMFDPCTLLTADEATAILGPLRSGPKPLNGPNGGVLQCTYTMTDGSLVNLSVVGA